MRKYLTTLGNLENREFYFAIGRSESYQYFGIFQNHPVFLLTNIEVNDPDLTSGHLALFLPWTYPVKRADQVLKLRPEEGYKTMEEIAQNAKTGH